MVTKHSVKQHNQIFMYYLFVKKAKKKSFSLTRQTALTRPRSDIRDIHQRAGGLRQRLIVDGVRYSGRLLFGSFSEIVIGQQHR